uniref:NTR domain-containing protein n=1 Tax=Laticauda laticaudata TaxID=8630 RepID=A0A8C5S8W2_LATLA
MATTDFHPAPSPLCPLPDTVCTACMDSGPSEKDFLEKVCNQDFALKMTIKSLSGVGGDLKVIPELRGRTLYKQASWSEEERKKPVLWLADGEACSCEELAGGPGTVVLAMGHRLSNRLVLSWVRSWKHGEKELKRFSRAVRKLQC